MFLYDLARKIKSGYKVRQKQNAGRFLSPVRRIERVAPIKGERLTAMTFDDGPSAAPLARTEPSANAVYAASASSASLSSSATNAAQTTATPQRSEKGLTAHILDTMNQYGAKGTFDVIGTTSGNYPDKAGKSGSFAWGGERFDHYPDFNMDDLAGAKNRPELIARIINEGHELTSHSYTHTLFGRIRMIYGKRACFDSIHDVISDLKLLDKLILNDHSCSIRLARPPHYVDKTLDGHSAYDAYRYMNYQYMAASFDGGGWKASSGDYDRDVSDMVAPLAQALEASPDALGGQIIFQKDGCSMSRLTPVADALPRHLELLAKHGYRVVTVSELLEISPFEDVSNDDSIFEAARSLIGKGYCIAYRNNTLQPDRLLTFGELVVMSASPEKVLSVFREDVDSEFTRSFPQALGRFGVTATHPYYHAFAAALETGVLFNEDTHTADAPVTPHILSDYIRRLPGYYSLDSIPTGDSPVRRRDAIAVLAEF